MTLYQYMRPAPWGIAAHAAPYPWVRTGGPVKARCIGVSATVGTDPDIIRRPQRDPFRRVLRGLTACDRDLTQARWCALADAVLADVRGAS